MDDPIRLPESKDDQNAIRAAENAAEETLVLDSPTQQVGSNSPPAQIGRYRIDKVLGEGAFGRVYLGYDEQLKRQVALKVPRRERVSQPEDVEAYLIEAQTLASLDHPAIVPVHDVGRTDDGLCYVVSKFIEGTDLQARLAKDRLTHHESADLVATVAEALHYAHSKGLVHRDVKPANILIDSAGNPHVADFGLALKEEDIGSGSGWAGTPNYMSPEQARGEGHRVDGRSDIFSVGVMFYEMLTGKRPFRGDTPRKLLEQITSVEARPLRQRDDSIPKELERICLKALSKKASDRYTAAKDMADDLRHFLSESPQNVSAVPVKSADPQVAAGTDTGITGRADTRIASDSSPATSASDSQPIRVVPKGLRSFDEHDADFFLELLPGPRDREGLPDGIRFWKTRIEETDADKTFAVGLIYGPSGCGKSSMVKAGLLPRLSDNVIPIYVEATLDETETRLLHGLRKKCSGLPDGLSLKDTLTALRRGQGVPGDKKVLIVLDQFEQWLHSHREAADTELVTALRQCDGSRVQVIVMVRDDFWMAATRFMRELEVRLVEGHNSNAVDLFPVRHARRVLTAFGRAFAELPQSPKDQSQDQTEFIKQSITGLAEEGKVICVRLALFADMMKGKPWTPATLKAVGGTTGIGVTFLEETFSASTAPPEHRYHQKAARNVLRALLPESGTDIKGHMRSSDELLEASGYVRRPGDFQDLLSILDSEIRLVTPTDPEGDRSDDDEVTPDAEAGQKYFQLTHDYLVPSLRDWLTRKQRETRKGRAVLRLAERTALWNAKPENRHLPSLFEWASICTLTDRKKWTDPERKMMGKAVRVIGSYTGLTGLGIVLLIFAGLFIAGQVEAQQNANYAKALVESLSAANTADVEDLVGEISDYQEWAIPLLQAIVANKDSNPKEKLHASLILVKDDPSHVDFLLQRLLKAEADDVPVIVKFLTPHGDQLDKQLWDYIATGSSSERIRAAAALAEYDSANEQWKQVGEDIVTALVAVPASESDEWIEMLRPVGRILAKPLEQRFRDRSSDRDAERPLASAALADYLRDNPQLLRELILLADNDGEFQPLLEAVRDHTETVASELQTLLSQSPPAGANRDAFRKKQANAAICLLELEKGEAVWPLFEQTPDPSLRSFLIDRLAKLGADYETLAARIDEEAEPFSRYALVLALGQFDAGKMSNQQKRELVEQLTSLYRDAPEPGVRSAAGWALRDWKQEQVVSEIDVKLSNSLPKQDRNWFVNSQGQTFAVVNGPVEFLMSEAERRTVTLSHRFAVATHEVTVAQFQKFRSDHQYLTEYAPQTDCPVNILTWYDAVAYCNWLTEEENLSRAENDQLDRCYEPNEKGEYAEGMTIPADYLQRRGYRLPTDEEWEFMCRAGTTSSYGFGESPELLTRYAWYSGNALSHMWSVGTKLPNALGMFDMHGNAYEWCHNSLSSQPAEVVTNKEVRVLRGGSFISTAHHVRSAYRVNNYPGYRSNNVGFRVSRTYP